MRISCSRCHAAYEVPDEKLQRAAVKIRCSQCGHLFVARRRPTDEEVPAVPFALAGPSDSSSPGAEPAAPDESLDLESFATEPQGAVEASIPPSLPEAEPGFGQPLADFDPESFGLDAEPAPEEAEAEPAGTTSSPENLAHTAPRLDAFDLSGFGLEGGAEPEEPASLAANPEASPEASGASEPSLDDFDLSGFGTGAETEPEEPEALVATQGGSSEASDAAELRLDDFDLSGFGLDPEPAPGASDAPAPSSAASEGPAGSALGLDDFDLSGFGMPGGAPPASPDPSGGPEEPRTSAPGEDDGLPDLDSLNFDDLEISSLGELDLGDFDAPGAFEEPAEAERFDSPVAPSLASEREPLERVRREELVAAPPVLKEVPVQGLAENIPQLDLQRGSRTEAKPTKSRLLARDRRHSPLLWFVLVVAAATLGYTGYNVFRHPEAFTFFTPSKLLEYWRSGQDEAKLAVDAKGYYRTFPGGRRAFVIRGDVTNHSEKPQGLIRVKGSLFGDQGAQLSVREAYCGNVLNDRELAMLPRETIEARLQNQVGEALSNVDIAPGGKVPFMLVFVPPPDAVEKYKVAVSAARAGAPQ